jgi:hypothetical protein
MSPRNFRALAGYVLFFLTVGATVIMAAAMASVRTAPAHAAPMRAAAVCTFDGGGVSVAGSVTRTSDGRAWLCTDDGDLVPWGLPVIAGGVCSMQGVCATFPYPPARR